MTKELSKKLCGLCELEPITRYHVEVAGIVYKISKENVLKHSKIFKSPSIKVGKVAKNYPDFTKPENFTRLWELVNNQKRTELIYRIYKRLLVEAGWQNDNLKQAVREAQWLYE